MVNSKNLIVLGLIGAGFIALGGVSLTRSAVNATRAEVNQIRDDLEERRQRADSMLSSNTSKDG